MPKADWSTRPLEDELGEVLRAELLSWPNLQARPVMGTLAFFRGKRMLGCYVNRSLAKKKTPYLNRPDEPSFIWVRLRPQDAERALKRKLVQPCRLGHRAWVEVALESRDHLEEALRWFGWTYEHPPHGKAKPSGAKRKLRKGT